MLESLLQNHRADAPGDATENDLEAHYQTLCFFADKDVQFRAIILIVRSGDTTVVLCCPPHSNQSVAGVKLHHAETDVVLTNTKITIATADGTRCVYRATRCNRGRS